MTHTQSPGGRGRLGDYFVRRLPPPPWWVRVQAFLTLMLMAGCIAAILFAALMLAGCAFAPNSTGGGVLGIPIGEDGDTGLGGIVERAPEAGGLIGGLFGGPAGAQVGTLIGTGLAGLFGMSALKQSKRRGQVEAQAALLRGKEAGWDARESAATVQAPLVSTTRTAPEPQR